MIKLLPIAAIVLLLLGSLYYLRFRNSGSSTTVPFLPALSSITPSPVPTSDSLAERIRVLETAVTYLLKQAGKSDSTAGKLSDNIQNTQSLDPTFESRLKLLETTTADLKASLSVTPVQVTVAKKVPVYIPLGTTWITNDQDGLVLPQFEVNINPADYAGYTSMTLEVNMRLEQKIGTAYAEVYNNTDQSTISNSQASTTLETYGTVASGNFQLANGVKTYRLKAKSSGGAQMNIQMARIRVNF